MYKKKLSYHVNIVPQGMQMNIIMPLINVKKLHLEIKNFRIFSKCGKLLSQNYKKNTKLVVTYLNAFVHAEFEYRNKSMNWLQKV